MVIVILCFSAGFAFSYKATVDIDYQDCTSTINKLIYGCNVKWLNNGEAISGQNNGIWDWEKGKANSNIKEMLKNSKITILRYGDGTNADYFYWGYSILPQDERRDMFVCTRWNCEREHYSFGVLEFARICNWMNCEKIIIVNYGMGILKAFYEAFSKEDNRSKKEIAIQQAVNYVEFMNGEVTSGINAEYPDKYLPEYSLKKMPKGYFAYLRASLGYPKPINVRYWEIGNEIYAYHHSAGRYSIMADPPRKIDMLEYAEDAVEFARAMKEVDQTIKVGVVSGGSNDQLTRKIIGLLGEYPNEIDFIVLHCYGSGISQNNKRATFSVYNTRPVSRMVEIKKGGKGKLKISAWGRAYFGEKFFWERGVAPKLELKVDGDLIGCIKINKNIRNDTLIPGQFDEYEVPVVLDPGIHEFSLRMVNDYIDRSMPDVNRRGRDVFINSWRLEGYGEREELLFKDGSLPETVYASIDGTVRALKNAKGAITQYAPNLFIAMTEGGVGKGSGSTLAEALYTASQINECIRHNVAIRNHWHLYGQSHRNPLIHSGSRKRTNYHRVPAFYVIKMFSEHFGSEFLPAIVKCPDFKAFGISSADMEKKIVPYVDVCVSRDNNNRNLYLSVINRSSKEPVELCIDVKNFEPNSGSVYSLRTDSPEGAMATNKDSHDNVYVKSWPLYVGNPFKVRLGPSTFSIVEVSGKGDY